MIVLLIILCVTLAYFIHQNRQLKSHSSPENQSKDRNNSKDIYENPDKVKDDGNYEQVEDEQTMYTALKRTEKEDDDHLYGHLNEVHHKQVNQAETGI